MTEPVLIRTVMTLHMSIAGCGHSQEVGVHFTLAEDSRLLYYPALPQQLVVAVRESDILVLSVVTVRVRVADQVGMETDRDVVFGAGEILRVCTGGAVRSGLETGVLALVRIQNVW